MHFFLILHFLISSFSLILGVARLTFFFFFFVFSTFCFLNATHKQYFYPPPCVIRSNCPIFPKACIFINLLEHLVSPSSAYLFQEEARFWRPCLVIWACLRSPSSLHSVESSTAMPMDTPSQWPGRNTEVNVSYAMTHKCSLERLKWKLHCSSV